jgi:hypothetical protein
MFVGLTWFERLTQLIQIFSFSSLVFFFMLVFLLCFLFFLINLFNYHTFMTQPCSQTNVQGSWVWCCSQSHLNLSHVSLILLLILQILLLGQVLQLDPRLLGIFLQKDLILLDLNLLYIFYARKKKLTRGVLLCFFFLSFSFLSLLLWTAQCSPQ